MNFVDKTPATMICECGMVLTRDYVFCPFCRSSDFLPIPHWEEGDRYVSKRRGPKLLPRQPRIDLKHQWFRNPAGVLRNHHVYNCDRGLYDTPMPRSVPKVLYLEELKKRDGLKRKMITVHSDIAGRMVTRVKRMGMERVDVGHWVGNGRVKSVQFFNHAHSAILNVVVAAIPKR